MGACKLCASYLIGKPVLGWRVGEWLENRCSRKVFHTEMPTLAIDFSLSGLASLPVVFVLPEEYVLNSARTPATHLIYGELFTCARAPLHFLPATFRQLFFHTVGR
jgi:hypothetical protein